MRLRGGDKALPGGLDRSNKLLRMTLTAYRTGGTDREIRIAIVECSLGSIFVAASDRGLCAIFLGDIPEKLAHDLEQRFPRAQLIKPAALDSIAAVPSHRSRSCQGFPSYTTRVCLGRRASKRRKRGLDAAARAVMFAHR